MAKIPEEFLILLTHPDKNAIEFLLLPYLHMDILYKYRILFGNILEQPSTLRFLSNRFQLEGSFDDFKSLSEAYDNKYATIRSYKYANKTRTVTDIFEQSVIEGDMPAFLYGLDIVKDLPYAYAYNLQKTLMNAVNNGRVEIAKILIKCDRSLDFLDILYNANPNDNVRSELNDLLMEEIIRPLRQTYDM